MAGKRVLDIGCRDGLFSFEAEKRGAREVIGIDNDLSTAAVEFLIPFFASKVRMHALNLYDLRRDTFGTFDVVIFAGVLYHLRYPFYALKLIRDVMEDGGTLFLETAVFVDDNRFSMLYCPVGAESPYEPTSVTFFNVKGLKDSLLTLGFKVERVELQVNLPPDDSAKEKVIDRVVMTCTADPELRRQDFAEYWEGKHNLHSTGTSGLGPDTPAKRSPVETAERR
jgi:SAM-dependent methyltransferase